jgi:hypothetical protein
VLRCSQRSLESLILNVCPPWICICGSGKGRHCLVVVGFFEETVRGLATYCDEKLGLRELVSQSFI